MKVMVSLSGGMDSTCLLSREIMYQNEVVPVIFFYGSKHNRYENAAAYKICAHYGLSPLYIDLSTVMEGFRSNLMKNGGEIPEGHYAGENMKLTVVPARNLIFISILAGLAESVGAEEIKLAVHSGDHHIYPDCRPEFIRAAAIAVDLASEGRVGLRAPFMALTKGEVLELGLQCNAPLHMTRTCYKDQPIACGKCGSCNERLEAFEDCGEKDPIPYAH